MVSFLRLQGPATLPDPGDAVATIQPLRLTRAPATKADVEAHFATHGTGEITEIKLMNGFGFIEYKDAMDARDVVPGMFCRCLLFSVYRLLAMSSVLLTSFASFSFPYVVAFAWRYPIL
jgi:hypothetical protein